MKWENGATACKNKVLFKKVSQAESKASFLSKTFGSKQWVYRCKQKKGYKAHWHLTTKPPTKNESYL